MCSQDKEVRDGVCRSVVGENIAIPVFSLSDSRAVKSFILVGSGSLVYELPREINTHGYLRNLTDQRNLMLEWQGNKLLKYKLK